MAFAPEDCAFALLPPPARVLRPVPKTTAVITHNSVPVMLLRKYRLGNGYLS